MQKPQKGHMNKQPDLHCFTCRVYQEIVRNHRCTYTGSICAVCRRCDVARAASACPIYNITSTLPFSRSLPFIVGRCRSQSVAAVHYRSQSVVAVHYRSQSAVADHYRSQPVVAVRSQSFPFTTVHSRSLPFTTVHSA